VIFIGNYNTRMHDLHSTPQPIRTGGGTDLAFVVMVLAAYFTTFSSINNISVEKLVIIIFLGVAYIAVGVYGYAYCTRHHSYSLIMGYFLVQIFLGEVIILLGGTVGFNAMIFLPLVGQSVVLLPEMSRYVVNGVIVILFAFTVRWMSGGWDNVWTYLPIFIAGQVFILVFTQMAVSEEQARHEIQNLVKDLETANRQLREYSLQAENLAIIKERNRMAREIHDGLGHHLTALNMQIKAAKAILMTDPLKAGDLLSNAEGLTQKALGDVRQSVSALRAEEQENKPLAEQIRSTLSLLESNGMEVYFQVNGEPRLVSAQISLALSRTAQECVNNIVKHSRAQRVSVRLDYSSAAFVCFIFQDDGVGSEDFEGGFGLIGMKERVMLLEGEISIRSARGKGFYVEIKLPG
jgi:signal transduction histidine kinase